MNYLTAKRPFGRFFLTNNHNLGTAALAVAVGLLLTQLSWWQGLTAVVATAVFLCIVIRPTLGLALALLLGPFGALENVIWGNALFDSGQLTLFLTVAAWLGWQLRRRYLAIPRTSLSVPLFCFVGVSLLSLLDAPSLTFGLREVIKWVEIWAVLLLVLAEGERALADGRLNRWLWQVVAMLLATGLLQALIGIWQFGLRGDGPAHFLIRDALYRAYGTFEQPNPFGGFMHLTALLAAGVVLAVGWPILQRVWGWLRQRPFLPKPTVHWLLLLFVALTAATAVLGVVASWSRGAWLSLVAGGATLLLFWPRRRWIGLLLFVGGAVGLLLAFQFNLLPASVSGRLVGFVADFQLGDVRGADINDTNYAVLERLAHWQTAIAMARHQLWLGVGFGNYEPAYADYDLPNWPDPLGHAHNYYLNLLAEVGVLGLAAYALLWGTIIWQTVRLLNQATDADRGIALGLLGSWVALSVHHLVDKLYVNNLYVHLGAMFGLLALLRLKYRIEQSTIGD